MIRSDPLQRAVAPYRRRLGLFSVLKALFTAATAGFFACGIAILILKILQRDIGSTPVIVFSAVFAVTIIAAFIASFPSYNYTARRLDALGLKERTSTMFALSGESTEIAALQRNDALSHIGGVNKEQLKEKISTALIILLIASIVFAAVCAIIPASWFDRSAEKSAEQVMRDVLEMLREEQRSLEEQGEAALSQEMLDLIEKLEQGESVLNAIGDINTAEENAVEDVINGEATPRAAREMIDVLEEAKRMLLDLEEAENGEGQGEGAIMIPGEGEEPMEDEGQGEEEGQGEGREQGEEPGEGGQGEQENNEEGQGRGRSGERAEEDERPTNMTERIYDPISGSVQYGDVFSVYLSDYLNKAGNGEIPFELKDASDIYFNSLDR